MLLRYILAIMILFSATIASGKQDFSKVTIKTSQLTDNIYMLTGAGGNMALCKGKRGVFLIDDQFAPLTDKILAAVSTISDKPVKFLINTHWHRDHTGGNENIGKGDTIIVAHENVRKRLAAGQFMKAFNAQIPPAPDQALPVITFPTALTFHWDQETIEVTHFPGAHTDGDAVIFFKTANIIHTGDLFFNGIYPFIDVQSGGSLSGMITSVEKLLQSSDKNTKIIPGHGPLGNRADLENYRVMLTKIHARISKMRAEGMTQDQIIAAKPTSDFDEKWGKGFLAPDKWVGIVYSSMN